MKEQDKINDLSLRERELLLKEKELELRERELKLKESEAQTKEERKEKFDQTLNTFKEKVFTSSKQKPEEKLPFFKLRPIDNTKLFSSDGVLSRKSFFFISVAYIIIVTILSTFWGVLLEVSSANATIGLGLISLIVFVILILPGIFMYIKRCRDCAISPWFSLLFSLIPFASLYIYFAKTKVDLNNYGENWNEYSKSSEYILSTKQATHVTWTIVIIYILTIVCSFAKGFIDGLDGY